MQNHIMPNSVIFLVDADNIFFGAVDVDTTIPESQRMGVRIDFTALKRIMTGNTNYTMQYAKVFVALGAGEHSMFHNMLSRCGYECKSVQKPPLELIRSSPDYKKILNMYLAVDAVTFRFRGQYPSKVVIASGSSDFTPVYEHLKEQGVRIEVMAFPGSLSKRVANLVDNVTYLDTTITYFDSLEVTSESR